MGNLQGFRGTRSPDRLGPGVQALQDLVQGCGELQDGVAGVAGIAAAMSRLCSPNVTALHAILLAMQALRAALRAGIAG